MVVLDVQTRLSATQTNHSCVLNLKEKEKTKNIQVKYEFAQKTEIYDEWIVS